MVSFEGYHVLINLFYMTVIILTFGAVLSNISDWFDEKNKIDDDDKDSLTRSVRNLQKKLLWKAVLLFVVTVVGSFGIIKQQPQSENLFSTVRHSFDTPVYETTKKHFETEVKKYNIDAEMEKISDTWGSRRVPE